MITDYTFPFRNECPLWRNESLKDVPLSLVSLGYELLFTDMITNQNTTKHKIHGVFSIVAKKDKKFYLFTGTYNHICALEGSLSIIPFSEQVKFNPNMQEEKRWSKWTNPMHDRREEAWKDMWRCARCFDTFYSTSEYIQTHMKNWEDTSNTLYWIRYVAPMEASLWM